MTRHTFLFCLNQNRCALFSTKINSDRRLLSPKSSILITGCHFYCKNPLRNRKVTEININYSRASFMYIFFLSLWTHLPSVAFFTLVHLRLVLRRKHEQQKKYTRTCVIPSLFWNGKKQQQQRKKTTKGFEPTSFVISFISFFSCYSNEYF